MDFSAVEQNSAPDKTYAGTVSFCAFYMLRRYIAYSTGFDLFHRDKLSECDSGKNADFSAGVKAVHIRARICFRIAQFLCVFKGGFIINIFLAHTRENIICCSVQNSVNFSYFI